MDKALLKVVKNESENADELYLYGPIRKPLPDEEDEEVIQLKDVKKKLDDITSNKLIVHLNTTGGDLFQSVAIHNLLKNHKAEVEIIVDGVAASGGSIIFVAGDKTKMYPNTNLYIHAAHTITYADAKGHREIANKLDKLDKSLKENYSERFNGSDRELENIIHSEGGTWLTAKEAKEHGFCDEIIKSNSSDEEAENRINNTLLKSFNKSNNKTKDRLMKKYANNKNLLSKFKKEDQ